MNKVIFWQVRLACQIQLDDSLNNVTVKLRKDELL